VVKKFGLGRGLDSLIPEDDENINVLNINRIKPNKEQPRKYFDEDKIATLAESIKEHGLIQPIIVQKDKDDYKIIAGERRWRAAKSANLKEVPVIIMDLTDSAVLEISLIENIQRQDLNPIEEANAYRRLIDDFKITQEELARKIGKSRTSITNTIRLTNLDDRVQEFLVEEILTEGHGRAILGLESKNEQFDVAQKAIDNGLNVRETEQLVSNYHKTRPIKTHMLNPYFKDIEKRLSTSMGTKVMLKPKAKNKGKIEIEYYSADELERILDYLKMEE